MPASENPTLIGTWHLDMEIDGMKFNGVTEYMADGTFQSRATYVMEDETSEVIAKGTWKLDGETLTTTVTESDTPDLLPVGEVSKNNILELTSTTLRCRNEDGLVTRETRDDPKAKPASTTPGRPVSPDETRAIHAAISRMQKSFRESDYDGMIKGTHPRLIDHSGGEAKHRELLENTVSMMQSENIKIVDEQLDDPAEIHEAGDEWVCFVPKRNNIEFGEQRIRSQGFYVAIRNKAEKEWKLIDGAGFRRNPELLWTLLPDLPRDVMIPEIKREVIDAESP